MDILSEKEAKMREILRFASGMFADLEKWEGVICLVKKARVYGPYVFFWYQGISRCED